MKRLTLLMLVTLALALAVALPALKGVQAASPPVTLAAIATNTASDQPQQVFHRGQTFFLSSDIYNHFCGQCIVTLHPVAYDGRYHLFNNSQAVIVPPDPGDHWFNYSVAIPRSAPLGTYHYLVVLKQTGYPNESRSMTFTVKR